VAEAQRHRVLASAVAGGLPEVIGDQYLDGSGNTYLPM
jgi:hypothetical protein